MRRMGRGGAGDEEWGRYGEGEGGGDAYTQESKVTTAFSSHRRRQTTNG